MPDMFDKRYPREGPPLHRLLNKKTPLFEEIRTVLEAARAEIATQWEDVAWNEALQQKS